MHVVFNPFFGNVCEFIWNALTVRNKTVCTCVVYICFNEDKHLKNLPKILWFVFFILGD
jgi:hypothetical protein